MRQFFTIFLTIALSFDLFSQNTTTFIRTFDPNPQNEYIYDKASRIWSLSNYLYIVWGFIADNHGNRNMQILKVNINTK